MTGLKAEGGPGFAVVSPEDAPSERLRRFFKHCLGVQNQRLFPRWSDFHLSDLCNEVLPFVAVVDVSHRDGMPIYVYRYWGTGHTKVKGVDRTGMEIARIPAAPLADIGVREYGMVIERRRPLVFVHSLSIYADWRRDLQVTARVPFSEDGETIDKVVSYANYDEDHELWQAVYEQTVAGGD